jgi:hypothetical protein
MAGFGFERVEGETNHLPRALARLVHLTKPKVFLGTVGGTKVRIHLRAGAEAGLRVTFTPRISERRASKLLGRLGIHPSDGSWL